MSLLIYERLFVFRRQFAYVGLLLTAAFILYDFAASARQIDQKTTSVKLSVSNNNCHDQTERDEYNYEGWQVKISREGYADQLFTVDKSGNAVVSITYADVGQYDISIIVPNVPEARVLSAIINYKTDAGNGGVVKEDELRQVNYQKQKSIGMNFYQYWQIRFGTPESPYLKVSVSEADCDQATKEENEIDVIVASHDCKSGIEWDELKVYIGKTEFNAYTDTDEHGEKSRRKVIKISTGKYEISVRSTNFPKTTIQYVDVFQMFEKKSKGVYTKDAGTYPADDSGQVTLTLDKSLWKKNQKFLGVGLLINVWGNCQNPTTDPKEFAIVKVKAISGTVESKEPITLFDRMLGRKQSILKKAHVDDKYREGTIIKTGADGLIVLESEYKHAITIENSTEVKLGTVMTAEGRRQLRAFIEKGKIKIERQSGDDKDNSSETTVETKTATVSSTKTIYNVSYNETTNQTLVSVEEGEVEVFPTDETLQPVTLKAHQQVQVSDKSISTITPYSGETGSKTTYIMIIVGVVIVALIGLLVIVGGIFIIYRIMNRTKV